VFTGIVRERGRVVSFENGRLVLETSVQAAVGDSIAVDGVCLTVVAGDDTTLAFDVVAETVSRSTLGKLGAGTVANVEPAVRAGEELGGHLVQGHVDGVGRVRAVEPEGEGTRVWIEAPPDVLRYCVEKGSVTVSGVSLTVAGLTEDAFGVALVPHTLAVTTLGELEPGDEVNIEADVIGKYVERLIEQPGYPSQDVGSG
jgi:riboflavin synthase